MNVVFTGKGYIGDLLIPREAWAHACVLSGHTVCSEVDNDTEILIASRGDTLKALNAAARHTPRVTYAVLRASLSEAGAEYLNDTRREAEARLVARYPVLRDKYQTREETAAIALTREETSQREYTRLADAFGGHTERPGPGYRHSSLIRNRARIEEGTGVAGLSRPKAPEKVKAKSPFGKASKRIIDV